MRQEAYDLVESVRGLGLELTGQHGPKSVRITGDTQTFVPRLAELKRALDAFDRAEGEGQDFLSPSPEREDKLKRALDGVLRLYALQGGDMGQAALVIREHLAEPDAGPQAGEKERKKKKEYVALPVFAPNGIKKKSVYKPRINLVPEMPGTLTIDDIRRLSFDVAYVEAISGNTLAADPHGRNKHSDRPGMRF